MTYSSSNKYFAIIFIYINTPVDSKYKTQDYQTVKITYLCKITNYTVLIQEPSRN